MAQKALKVVAKANIDVKSNGKLVEIKKGDSFILYGTVFAYKDILIDIKPIIDLFDTEILPPSDEGKIPQYIFTANLQVKKSDGTVVTFTKGTRFIAIDDVVYVNGVVLDIAEHTDCIAFEIYVEDIVHVTEVTLDHDTLELAVEGEATLVAEVVPDNATYPEVAWESSDTEVATVDETGKVIGVKAGEATITATADGQSATCIVTVA